MFSYYGSKSKVVKCYPKPTHDTIKEPFAGSARYSLQYFEKDVILIEKWDWLVRLWLYLQRCSEGDILKLPKLRAGEKINRNDFDCVEQGYLMGYLIANGTVYPQLTVSKWGAVVMEKQKKDIAANLFKIRHWKIIQGDFTECDPKAATWFIDPPYQFGGDKYVFSNKKINYAHLAKWCKEREGQVIVCENTKADWLQFSPMKKQNGIRYTTTEAIWTNAPSIYSVEQTKLSLV